MAIRESNRKLASVYALALWPTLGLLLGRGTLLLLRPLHLLLQHRGGFGGGGGRRPLYFEQPCDCGWQCEMSWSTSPCEGRIWRCIKYCFFAIVAFAGKGSPPRECFRIWTNMFTRKCHLAGNLNPQNTMKIVLHSFVSHAHLRVTSNDTSNSDWKISIQIWLHTSYRFLIIFKFHIMPASTQLPSFSLP